MESRQLFRYGVTGAGLSHSSSYSTVPSIPSKLFTALKSVTRNSPNSPFSTQFDCESIASLSDSPEQQSFKENFAGVSPYNSPLESSSCFHQSSSSSNCWQSSLSRSSSGPSSIENVNSIQKIKHALVELETALMAPDDDEEVTRPQTFGGNSNPEMTDQQSRAWNQGYHGSPVIYPQPSIFSKQRHTTGAADSEKRQKTTNELSLQSIPSGNLKQLLIACAKALAENSREDFDKLIGIARGVVSISGEPIQRLGAYMVEGLVARREASGSNIYHALNCREPTSGDLLSYMHILYEICPYLKFGYMVANGAIAEACRNEDHIHIIDFQIAQGTQWVTLLQALATRSGGAPHVRITGIDDPVSKYARGAGLDAVGRCLAALSEKFNIPVEFHGVPVFPPEVTKDMLHVRPGEALVVNFPLQLHHTPDESVEMNNPRDGLLRLVKSLSPKVTTLVEQESNTNTAPFLPRFIETLECYLAMFESIDVTLPRDRKERINVEQHCLARDIVNIIACEGKERVERHELFGKWKSRLTMAGFQQVPLSPYVNSVIRGLLRNYSEHYTLIEKDGAMLLGWKKRNLISASAWH